MWKKTAVRALASLMPKSTADNSLQYAREIETNHELGKLVRPTAPDGGVITIDANDYSELEEDAGNPEKPESLSEQVKPKTEKPAAKTTPKKTPAKKPAEKKPAAKEEPTEESGRPFTEEEPAKVEKTPAVYLEEILNKATGGDETQMTAFLKFLTKQKVELADLREGRIDGATIKEAIAVGEKELGG